MKALLVVAIALAALAFATQAAAVGSPWDTSFSGDGKVTTDFGNNDAAADVVVQPDGKIVAAGTRGGDFGAFAVARYNTDGSLDTSFSADGKAENSGGFATGSEAYAVALQPDGKIVVAGYVGSIAWSTREFHLQRYNTDGSLDTSFSGDGTVGMGVGTSREDIAFALAVQPDGKILAAGRSCNLIDIGITCLGVVMRFQPDGSLDPGFAGGIVVIPPDTGFDAVGVQNDGTVVAAGYSGSSGLLVRYSAGGALLGSHLFHYDADNQAAAAASGLAIQPDGRVLVAGPAWVSGFVPDLGVARFDSAGSLDPSFSGDGRVTDSFTSGGATDLALRPDGRVVVVGSNSFSVASSIVRYTTGGALDPSFNDDGRFSDSFPAYAVALSPDGKIVVVGSLGGDFFVGRFSENGGDGTRPVLTLPATIVAEATSASGAVVPYTVTATDNEDSAPNVACTPVSGSTFALGQTTVSCTATDDAGNSATGSFVVRIVDTIAPTITAGSIRVNADSPAGAVVNYLVLVDDVADPSPTLQCQPPAGRFPIGVTTVTCTAQDASGNQAVRSFTITVVGFRDQVKDLNDAIANLPLTGQADLRRDNALQFCQNAFAPGNWASNSMPRTNDAGRFALLEIRQCVLYLKGPPTEVATASASIRLTLINLVCRIAHIRYDEVRVAPGANSSRLVQARTSLDQADAAPGTDEALFDCVNAWAILRNEPPQYTS